jgi:hypothetical protein
MGGTFDPISESEPLRSSKLSPNGPSSALASPAWSWRAVAFSAGLLTFIEQRSGDNDQE